MAEAENKPTPEQEIREICKLIVDSKDDQLVYEFFQCLFTNSELRDFSKRWSLVKELRAGTTQREIAKKYNISLCNITRGSRELKKEDSAFKKMLALLDSKNQ
ncbi:MAG: transcriptional regulator [Treponema sp.]|nr:transcriptional regulator [Candidatus Treponema equi]